MAEVIEWREGVVRATRDLTSAIRLIEIEPSGEFIAASPGSHINVSVMIRGRPDVRSYSVVGPCADGIYRIAVKLLDNTRGGSAYMWSLKPGGRIALSAPANHFNLALGRTDYLLAGRRHRRHADLHPRARACRSEGALSAPLCVPEPRRPRPRR